VSDLTYLIRTACMDCGLTWRKPWPEPEPEPDDGPVKNHSLCDACGDIRERAIEAREQSAFARANEEATQ